MTIIQPETAAYLRQIKKELDEIFGESVPAGDVLSWLAWFDYWNTRVAAEGKARKFENGGASGVG